MTEEEPYTNLDLDTAEELLIAAGKKELAQALRFQAQGVRNLVQGEWGKSFVGALENIMDTRVISVFTSVQRQLDEQIGLVQQLINMVQKSNTTAEKALAVNRETARGLGKLRGEVKAQGKRMDASEEDRKALHAADDEILGQIAALRGEFTTYVAGSKRDQLEDLRREIDLLKQARGNGTD